MNEKCSEIKILIENNPSKIGIKLKDDSPVKIAAEESISIAAPTYHRDLLGLDYESSGHTGFASSKEVKLLLPKDISVLPKNDLTNRKAQIYLYDDTKEEKETQITVEELLDSKIKTVDTVPTNLQDKDYIFLEIKR